MRKTLAALVVLLGTSSALADTWGPGEGHIITNMRVYPDGSLVFQFSPGLNAGCQYNDHSITPQTAPSYKLLSSLALTAYLTQKKVRIIYSGCNGNVNVTGLIVL